MRGRDEKSISDNFLYMLKAKLFKTRHFFAFARDIMSLRPVICYLWKIKTKSERENGKEREIEREREKRDLPRDMAENKCFIYGYVTLYVVKFI